MHDCILFLPTAYGHIYSAVRKERDALGFQQLLPRFGKSAARYGAVCHDDALPGQIVRAKTHGTANLARRAGPA